MPIVPKDWEWQYDWSTGKGKYCPPDFEYKPDYNEIFPPISQTSSYLETKLIPSALDKDIACIDFWERLRRDAQLKERYENNKIFRDFCDKYYKKELWY